MCLLGRCYMVLMNTFNFQSVNLYPFQKGDHINSQSPKINHHLRCLSGVVRRRLVLRVGKGALMEIDLDFPNGEGLIEEEVLHGL